MRVILLNSCLFLFMLKGHAQSIYSVSANSFLSYDLYKIKDSYNNVMPSSPVFYPSAEIVFGYRNKKKFGGEINFIRKIYAQNVRHNVQNLFSEYGEVTVSTYQGGIRGRYFLSFKKNISLSLSLGYVWAYNPSPSNLNKMGLVNYNSIGDSLFSFTNITSYRFTSMIDLGSSLSFNTKSRVSFNVNGHYVLGLNEFIRMDVDYKVDNTGHHKAQVISKGGYVRLGIGVTYFFTKEHHYKAD